jgi:hypothetical protein
MATKPEYFKKSFEMVGEYMCCWASMETKIDVAFGAALNLSRLQRIVVCSNIAFNTKCNILLVLMNSSYFNGIEEYQKAIKKALAISADRNLMVHHEFFPEEGEDFIVRFFAYKARGKIDIPSVTWSEKVFDRKIAEINALRKAFEALETRLSPTDIEDALNKIKTFTPGHGLLGEK